MGPIGHQKACLYQFRGGVWKEVACTGNQLSFAQRPLPHIHTAFPLTVPPGQTDTFYMSMDYGKNYKTFAFALLTPRKLHQLESKVYFLFGLLTGVLLLFGVLNLYLFYSLKEKIHLWYTAYILALVFMLLKYEGFDEQFFPLDSAKANRLTPVMAIGGLTIFLLMNVVQRFLSNIHPRSLLFRLTTLVKYNLLLSAITHIIVFYAQADLDAQIAAFEWANKSTFLAIVLILVNCIVSYARKFKPALFLLVGISIFLLGALQKILFWDSTSYLFPPSLFEIGMVVEAGIISFGLMYRYSLFKKEKERLESELAVQNETAARKVLLAQEVERKRIAEDLHDDLGSSLAALKMRLQRTGLAEAELRSLLPIVDRAASEVRTLAHNLMPPEFEQTSLPDLLSAYYRTMDNETGVRFQFICTGTPLRFPKDEELLIYRIIMELTTNIVKHSGATEATLQLFYTEDSLEVMVEDNGKGIREEKGGGIGLKNVRSRVEYSKGELKIDSSGQGTTIIIKIPFKPKHYAPSGTADHSG